MAWARTRRPGAASVRATQSALPMPPRLATRTMGHAYAARPTLADCAMRVLQATSLLLGLLPATARAAIRSVSPQRAALGLVPRAAPGVFTSRRGARAWPSVASGCTLMGQASAALATPNAAGYASAAVHRSSTASGAVRMRRMTASVSRYVPLPNSHLRPGSASRVMSSASSWAGAQDLARKTARLAVQPRTTVPA